MLKKLDILLGIATYKRPRLLAGLLTSLAEQTIFQTETEVEIVIVEKKRSSSISELFNQNTLQNDLSQ